MNVPTTCGSITAGSDYCYSAVTRLCRRLRGLKGTQTLAP
jgi:hypothetical protein